MTQTVLGNNLVRKLVLGVDYRVVVCRECGEPLHVRRSEVPFDVELTVEMASRICPCLHQSEELLRLAHELDWETIDHPEGFPWNPDNVDPGTVDRADSPRKVVDPVYVIFDRDKLCRRIPDEYSPWQRPVRFTIGDPIAQPQFDVVYRLALGHGHGWAEIIQYWISSLGGNISLLRGDSERIYTGAIEEIVDRYPERHGPLGPGITAPHVLPSGVIHHRSEGGRIGWEVDRGGNARLKVYRPCEAILSPPYIESIGMPVLSAIMPYGSTDDPEIKVAGTFHYRHMSALLRMIKALR